MKGILVFYLDVGNLSPMKAEAFVERVKEKFKDGCERIKDAGYEIIILPVRPNSATRVEFIPMGDNVNYCYNAGLGANLEAYEDVEYEDEDVPGGPDEDDEDEMQKYAAGEAE